MSDVVLADAAGSELSLDTAGSCVALPCTDEDSDTVCDHADDCVGAFDCNGNCASVYILTWVGDGYCDATGFSDNSVGYGYNFLCEEYDFDNGDCDSYADCAGDYFGNASFDCAGTCNGSATTDACGVCDADSTNDNVCLEFGCADGYVADCSGEPECAPASWIGDGSCDGEDQAWGYDLSCYDEDGGDCSGPAPAAGDSCTFYDSWYGYYVTGTLDCQLQCVDNYYVNSWVGDGSCDDGAYGLYFDCEYFGNDGGDCGRSNDQVANEKVFNKDHKLIIVKSEPNTRADQICLEYSGPDVDECGVCFGDGVDADQDDVCDDVDDCVGAYDSCGVCNGPGYATGDFNYDCLLDILDIVAMIGFIIDDNAPTDYDGDINGDGVLDVIDVVNLVLSIVNSSSRSADATSANMSLTNNSLSLSANGYIGGVQMTLDHAEGFELNLTNNAMFAEFRTNGTSTKLIVIEPTDELIFTTNQSFDIVEMIVANSKEEIEINTISEFGLTDAYPNPFNPSTTFTLAVPSADYVSVKVYNLMGQVVGTLAEGMMEASVYTFTWNASDMSSGVYLIKAESSSSIDVQKVLLVK